MSANNIAVPPRLSKRVSGRDWPIPGVLAGFAVIRANSAAAAYLFAAWHLLLEIMAVPGTYRLLARHSRLKLVGISGTEWVALPLPSVDGESDVSRCPHGAQRDIQIDRRGILSGRIVLSGAAFYVPRRQHRDLAALLPGLAYK